MSVVRCLIDGMPADQVEVADRGFSYGDGLFETVRLAGTLAPLWPRHLARLREGCRRLGIPAPDGECLWDELLRASAGLPEAVLRVSVTRGTGPRGYAPPVSPQPRRVVQAAPAPPPWSVSHPQGLRLRTCSMRLGWQPALAGIKHLNRLEQVLARAEWRDPAIDEGLLLDQAGRPISATAANLFAWLNDAWCTPRLDQAGVAGVARAEVLAHCLDAQVRPIGFDELLQAREIVLTSSVRGIAAVRQLDGHYFAAGAATRALQAHWHTCGFATGI